MSHHVDDELGRLRALAETIADEHADTQQHAAPEIAHRFDDDICAVIVAGFRIGGETEASKIADVYVRRTNRHRARAEQPLGNTGQHAAASRHQFPTATADERALIVEALLTSEG